jgi:hypothetical protein
MAPERRGFTFAASLTYPVDARKKTSRITTGPARAPSRESPIRGVYLTYIV